MPPESPDGGGAAIRQWIGNERALRDHILNEKDPRAFLRWDIISSSMVFQDPPRVQTELEALQRSDEWSTRWSHAIEESRAGCPRALAGNPGTSANLVHHAYHAFSFERHTGLRLNEFATIFEFGGGYGSFCRLTHKLGFRGRYAIFDLPTFLALQRFYLQLLSHDDGFASDAFGKVIHSDDLNKIETVIEEKAVFVATWSLSEIEPGLRDEITSLIEPCSAQLIAYQETFGGIDNSAEFKKWTQRFPKLEWQTHHIDGLPGNFYLFGRKPS